MLESALAITSSFLSLNNVPLAYIEAKKGFNELKNKISQIHNITIKNKNVPIIDLNTFDVRNVVLNVTGYTTWFKHINDSINKTYIPEDYLNQKNLSNDVYVEKSKRSNGLILEHEFTSNHDELGVDMFNKLVQFERERNKHGAGK